MTERLLSHARAGDELAFRELTDAFRRELELHCYRILGSLQDAEDMLQETLLAAWRGLDEFEGRASLRTWLYRIATNRCLNLLRSKARRPAEEVPPMPEPPIPATTTAVWLSARPPAGSGTLAAASHPSIVMRPRPLTRSSMPPASIRAISRRSSRIIADGFCRLRVIPLHDAPAAPEGLPGAARSTSSSWR